MSDLASELLEVDQGMGCRWEHVWVPMFPWKPAWSGSPNSPPRVSEPVSVVSQLFSADMAARAAQHSLVVWTCRPASVIPVPHMGASSSCLLSQPSFPHPPRARELLSCFILGRKSEVVLFFPLLPAQAVGTAP